MLAILQKLFSPLLALFIICMGSSLNTTLVSLRMDDLGTGNFMLGVASAAFYLGMALGAFKIESFVSRFGHIRSYSVMASIAAICGVTHMISDSPFAWIGLRFFSGVAIAGVYVVIESWLLTYCDNQNRGKILAIYMVALYAAQSLGQFFVKIGDPGSIIPFIIIAVLANLSIIPLSFTTSRQPVYEEPSVMTLRKLYSISPSGITTCFVAGLILSAIYTLVPRAMDLHTFSEAQIANLMAFLIFGGMALQYPFGWLADRFDKRTILMGLCALTALVSFFIFTFIFGYSKGLFIALFLLGGLTFVIQPIAMSHTCDYADPEDIVPATGGLVLVYSIGCIIGPLVAPLFMYLFGPNGVYGYIAICGAGLGVFMFYRSGIRPAPPMEEQQTVVVQNPHTTPVANEIDPVISELKEDIEEELL